MSCSAHNGRESTPLDRDLSSGVGGDGRSEGSPFSPASDFSGSNLDSSGRRRSRRRKSRSRDSLVNRCVYYGILHPQLSLLCVLALNICPSSAILIRSYRISDGDIECFLVGLQDRLWARIRRGRGAHPSCSCRIIARAL